MNHGFKSLKDLGFCGTATEDKDYGTPYAKEEDVVSHEELRAEAIKWIKAFNAGECHTDYAADGRNGQENICEWITDFFNLGEV